MTSSRMGSLRKYGQFDSVEADIRIRGLVLAGVMCVSGVMSAQAPGPDLASHPDWPKAQAADVATIESTVKAFYNAISAPAGGKLDRTRLRSLFVPGGRIAVGIPEHDGRAADLVFRSLDEYADASDAATAKEGFFDRNPANQVERFGVMAHVYSTYESRAHEGDAKPMARGIKSIELLNSGGRWYIVQVYWDSERPGNLLPEKYLKGGTE